MTPSDQIASMLLTLGDAGPHGWDWDGGWWLVMGIGMLLFWGLLIVGGVWLARELTGRRQAGEPDDAALDTLERRLAGGEITIEEFGERRTALLDARRRSGRDG